MQTEAISDAIGIFGQMLSLLHGKNCIPPFWI